MGGVCAKNVTADSSMYYYSPSGTLVTFKPIKIHSRKDELSFVNTEDSPFAPLEECYLIHAMWLDVWFAYCSWNKGPSNEKAPKMPSHIPNYDLIDQTTAAMKPFKEVKTDFRPVKKKVWEYLFNLYGGSPVIYCIGMS